LVALFFLILAAGPAAQPQSNPPFITRLELQGKRLIVTGTNLDENARVFVDGERQKTRPDSDSPGTVLIAKWAGSNIDEGSPSRITVRNPDGQLSNLQLIYKADSFSAQYVMLAILPPQSINNDRVAALVLRAGEYFIVDLGPVTGSQNTDIRDPQGIVQLVVQDGFPQASGKYLYRVTASGNAELSFKQTFDTPPPFPPFILTVFVNVQ